MSLAKRTGLKKHFLTLPGSVKTRRKEVDNNSGTVLSIIKNQVEGFRTMSNPNHFTEEILRKRMYPKKKFLNRANAFTLVEILIVVVIISIAAMIVVPLASSAAGIQIKSAANMIAADLEYAKSRAITRGEEINVVFDQSTETYRIKDKTDLIKHPVKNGYYIIDLKEEGLGKVDLSDADFDSTNTVYFDYLGSPYTYNNSTGDRQPLNNGLVTLNTANNTLKVKVEAVTGFISVSE